MITTLAVLLIGLFIICSKILRSATYPENLDDWNDEHDLNNGR